MKMTKSSWNISSNYGRSKLTSLASLLTLALALCLPSSGMASLTVVDTGERYGSRVDHTYGRVFKRGFEYMARLQYLEGNFHLCPSKTKPQQVWNLTYVPADFPGTNMVFVMADEGFYWFGKVNVTAEAVQ